MLALRGNTFFAIGEVENTGATSLTSTRNISEGIAHMTRRFRAFSPVLICLDQPERAGIGVRQQLLLIRAAALPDRSDGVSERGGLTTAQGGH